MFIDRRARHAVEFICRTLGVSVSAYTSINLTQTLTDHGVLQSVGSVGDAYDNAMAESFVDTLKTG